jgi:hypothetical protein
MGERKFLFRMGRGPPRLSYQRGFHGRAEENLFVAQEEYGDQKRGLHVTEQLHSRDHLTSG